MSKLVSFFHRHPGIKTTTVAVGGAILTAAGNGLLGPKGVIIAGAISSLIGLFLKRPQDGSGS